MAQRTEKLRARYLTAVTRTDDARRSGADGRQSTGALLRSHGCQKIAPLARTVCPETQPAVSLISQPTTGATSSGRPRRLRGLWCVAAAIASDFSAPRW
jgi:hypothetical protein